MELLEGLIQGHGIRLKEFKKFRFKSKRAMSKALYSLDDAFERAGMPFAVRCDLEYKDPNKGWRQEKIFFISDLRTNLNFARFGARRSEILNTTLQRQFNEIRRDLLDGRGHWLKLIP